MARHHLALHAMPAAAAAFLAVCAVALALCASHAAPERLRRALASVSRRRTEPAIIISIHQVQPGVVGGEADDGLGMPQPPCVWQKNILMGGKCQLPDFSGVINYDAAGNVVAPAGRAGARLVRGKEKQGEG
ncbi:hypothetical protein E2562_006880 [Oryza meyeriana var. granulata]|uniref:Uncharacterized protein n=1 Tax=Oryza meyeriana var. granulata TaxID=110450 RepID=A0A6G1BHZ3_9ORYZ|nr:hypothetical protein E2562_006880 [Oryza meyeriana var. granulata]